MKKLTTTEKALILEMNKNEVANTLLNAHNKFLLTLQSVTNDSLAKDIIENQIKIMEMRENQLKKLYKIS